MAHRLISLTVLATSTVAGLCGQSTLDPGALYKQASPAVVLIEAIGPDGKAVKTGSGFLVSGDGRLLTNYHVISHVKQATVKLANGDAYDLVEVITLDKRKDIALLKIPAVELPTAKLGKSGGTDIGSTVYSIGNPLGLQNTLSQGLVSGIREMDGYRLFQMSAPISPGSSGGPIFNGAGEVIGIAVLTIDGGQNLNFAIPIDYARGMLSMTQTQSLASIYEPAPDTEKDETGKSEMTGSRGVTGAAVPAEIKKSSFLFLEAAMGKWNLADAKSVLGEPTRQRDAFAGKVVDGIIFAFPDPTGLMREFELNFANSTGKLRAVYASPYGLTLQQAQAAWGRNYREIKNADSTRSYVYNDRRLIVIVNSKGAVTTLGVYLP